MSYADELIDRANRAYQAGEYDQAKAALWLLRTLFSAQEPFPDPQWDYENEAREQGVTVKELLR